MAAPLVFQLFRIPISEFSRRKHLVAPAEVQISDVNDTKSVRLMLGNTVSADAFSAVSIGHG
jgi:hypothetical protein